jgi:uncharacterized RmlC-like cupin family protein
MSKVRIVRADELTEKTGQTPGMRRRTAIDASTAGARNLWVGFVTMEPGAASGAHHHGDSESVIYMIRGRARFPFGDRLQEVAEAGPGDFIYVPPHVVHQEINASDSEGIEMIVTRDSQENVVVNVATSQELRDGERG